MPIHMDISPINRLVVIIARGQVAAEEIAEAIGKLMEAKVPGYAKIIDVSGSTSDLTKEQVEKVAALRGHPADAERGAVAFVVDPKREGFADLYAEVTKGERPVQLFTSLHEARKWLIDGGAHGGAAGPKGVSAVHRL